MHVHNVADKSLAKSTGKSRIHCRTLHVWHIYRNSAVTVWWQARVSATNRSFARSITQTVILSNNDSLWPTGNPGLLRIVRASTNSDGSQNRGRSFVRVTWTYCESVTLDVDDPPPPENSVERIIANMCKITSASGKTRIDNWWIAMPLTVISILPIHDPLFQTSGLWIATKGYRSLNHCSISIRACWCHRVSHEQDNCLAHLTAISLLLCTVFRISRLCKVSLPCCCKHTDWIFIVNYQRYPCQVGYFLFLPKSIPIYL